MPHSLLTLAWSLPDPSGALLTAFGIGLVIFVHEFGHFLCARAVGVDVEIFSLGFGPRLCGVVIRGTDYRISGVPLGGYVKVRGDQPGDADSHPGSYASKTIGQKFLVRAGGVLANLAFAIAVFPLTFGAGVEMEAPILGRVDPAGPAWRAGLRPGDEVLQIAGRPIHSFTDVFLEVALADPDGVPIEVKRDDAVTTVVAHPEYSTAFGTYALRVEQALTPSIRVMPGGVAEKNALSDGDAIVAIDGVSEIERFPDLLASPEGDAVALSVRGADGGIREVSLAPEWRKNDRAQLVGIGPVTLEIVAVRERYARADAPLRVGDRVVAAAERAVYTETDLARAVARLASGAKLPLGVARGDATFVVEFNGDGLRELLDDVAFGPVLGSGSGGLPGVPIVVSRGSSAERAGLVDGDRLLRIDGEATAEWKHALERAKAAHSRSSSRAATAASAASA
jgi:regulator of sigma E protease